MKILIVDDSIVFRSAIKAALNGVAGIEVVGAAPDGKIAIEKMQQLQVDLVTLDLEMPRLNGIETIKELKKMGHKARIIVFAAESTTGASLALEALRAGADDFLAKGKSSSAEEAQMTIAGQLVPKILQFSQFTSPEVVRPSVYVPGVAVPVKKSFATIKPSSVVPEVIVIGSSTGGPNALEKIFERLKGPILRPIFITQHMPPVFTEILAKRIQSISGISCVEAKQWMPLEANKIYVAPGDFHMSIYKKAEKQIYLKLDQGPLRNNVRPAVDSLFESAALLYGKDVLAFVLTGMGEDGLVGARAIKSAGGAVMIQDKESSVVFGMPGAIFNAGLYDEIGNLDQISKTLQTTATAPLKIPGSDSIQRGVI